jgi:hypothetical protein
MILQSWGSVVEWRLEVGWVEVGEYAVAECVVAELVGVAAQGQG